MAYSIFLLLVTVGLLCGSSTGAENSNENEDMNGAVIKDMNDKIITLEGTAYFNIDMSQTSLDDVYAPAIPIVLYSEGSIKKCASMR